MFAIPLFPRVTEKIIIRTVDGRTLQLAHIKSSFFVALWVVQYELHNVLTENCIDMNLVTTERVDRIFTR